MEEIVTAEMEGRKQRLVEVAPEMLLSKAWSNEAMKEASIATWTA